MNDRVELVIERSKPNKYQLRFVNKVTKESVVILEGRANECYDTKEAMEKVAKG